MARTYGLGAQIADKIDAAGRNPNVLQREYSESQKNQAGGDLLTLLALQKVKSDTEKAKQELAASQKTNPKTIAEQYVDEAIKTNLTGQQEKIAEISKLKQLRKNIV